MVTFACRKRSNYLFKYTFVNEGAKWKNWENSDIIDKFILYWKKEQMYSFLKLNIIKSMHIHTDANGLSQFNKMQDMWLLDVPQCENYRVF